MDVSNIKQNFINGAQIFLKEVKDPTRFGVAEIIPKLSMNNNQANVINIEEKPQHPKSNLAVTGIYIYDNTVFDKIRQLKFSDRNELEVTDLNNLYIKENKIIATIMNSNDILSDAGTFESLKYISNLI